MLTFNLQQNKNVCVCILTDLVPLSHGADSVLQEDTHAGPHLLSDVTYHLLEHWLQFPELPRHLRQSKA